ncbi:MAG: hypothetical protein HY646_21165 [Acidobacteria bacterium]|nr:hypothetical protein [Acidobacteriota bacterium]
MNAAWHRRKQVLLLASSFLLSALLIHPIQQRIDARYSQDARIFDLLYFASPTVVKRMALGYDGLLADIYWMRAIQYYGRRQEAARRAVRYGNLASLLDITTTLDPDLIDAYRFGGSFLAEDDPVGAGQPMDAIKLLDKGIVVHPQEWRLHFDKGFVNFWQLRDFRKAGEVWLAASRLPSAPYWMEGLAATGHSKRGAVETARALWERQYQESERADIKENARNHLLSMEMDETRWTLEFFVEKYRKRFERRPETLEGLVRPGFLKQIPKDPSGVPFVYYPETGEVRVSLRTGTKYLRRPPYDYREQFMEKLAQQYGRD